MPPQITPPVEPVAPPRNKSTTTISPVEDMSTVCTAR